MNIKFAILALASALCTSGARGFDEPGATAADVRLLQGELQEARREIARLRAEQEEQRRMIQLLLDANPGVKANIVKKLEDEAAAQNKAEQAARAAAAAEQQAATTIAHVAPAGFQVQLANGKVYDVVTNANAVAMWPAGSRFELTALRFKMGPDGKVYDLMESPAAIPIQEIGGTGKTAALRYNAQATALHAEIAGLLDRKATGDNAANKRLEALSQDPKAQKIIDGTCWQAPGGEKPKAPAP